jgi:hypothetical protein
MSITFIGPSGSCEVPWIRYALLRDNILHHLDHGAPSAAFSEVYRISQVLGGKPLILPAIQLREEISRARSLCLVPIDQMAMSARTRAVLSLEEDLPSVPPTFIVGSPTQLPWISGDPSRLGDIFGSLVESLLSLTRDATDTDTVEVLES